MGKKRVMVPAQELDLSTVKYEHEVIKAPHLTGLMLKLFVRIIEAPVLGSLIVSFLKKQNKMVEMLQNTVIPEAPMFKPEFPPQDAELSVLTVDGEGKPEDRVESALKCLPHYDPAICWTGDSLPSFRYWKIRDYAHAYRSKLVTPSTVAEQLISVIEGCNYHKPPTPLLVSFDAEEIRKQASASTQRFEEGNPLSILDGIFMVIKDDIDCYPHPSKGATTWMHEVRSVEKDDTRIHIQYLILESGGGLKSRQLSGGGAAASIGSSLVRPLQLKKKKMRLLLWWCLWAWLMVGERVIMGATESSGERKLDQTPTWAVAGVCAVIIIISILLEKVLHKLGTWFTERHKRALYEALDKVKAELMVLGFISLLLTFSQNYIANICIPTNVADTMLPCKADSEQDNTKSSEEEHRRRLLWFDHRILAAAATVPKCKEGHEPLISTEGLHQLHILIFFLAVFHVLYSFVTMMLGRLKIRGWKVWEQETLSHDYQFSNDPSRFRLTHETSFVKAHTSFWTRIPFFFYIGCFLRQFFRSVGRVDYLTLRNGFITVHLAPGSKFDFQKYIKRSLEDDFKIVVGVSPVLWASFVVFLLLNVRGWQALFWASIIPVIIILAVGTKLQAILTKMALEITERHAVVQGIPLVQGSDKYFWFGRPQLVLYLIHFALFQYSFGLKSCFHNNFKLAIIKVSLGVGVLCLCSYITLPLYALVTQMGSGMKKSIFDEQTSKALKKWHMAARKKHGEAGKSPTRTPGGSASPASKVHSPGQTLHRSKTTGHSTSSSYTYEDHDISDLETEPLSPMSSTNLIIRVDHGEQATEISETPHVEAKIEDDFSFVKPAPLKEVT